MPCLSKMMWPVNTTFQSGIWHNEHACLSVIPYRTHVLVKASYERTKCYTFPLCNGIVCVLCLHCIRRYGSIPSRTVAGFLPSFFCLSQLPFFETISKAQFLNSHRNVKRKLMGAKFPRFRDKWCRITADTPSNSSVYSKPISAFETD